MRTARRVTTTLERVLYEERRDVPFRLVEVERLGAEDARRVAREAQPLLHEVDLQ
jgi:hypothetical protein